MSSAAKIRKVLGSVSVSDAIWVLRHPNAPDNTALSRKVVQELRQLHPELASFPNRLWDFANPRPTFAVTTAAEPVLTVPAQLHN